MTSEMEKVLHFSGGQILAYSKIECSITSVLREQAIEAAQDGKEYGHVPRSPLSIAPACLEILILRAAQHPNRPLA